MKSVSNSRCIRAGLLVVTLLLADACKDKAPKSTVAAATPAPSAAPSAPARNQTQDSSTDTLDSAPSWLSKPTVSTGTTVLEAVDPHSMSPTEIQFGVAPKLSKDVEYQPNVIIMEQGDKAIKSVAGDGTTWTFDANAPHVSEFAEGKIVFATGRAVGRVAALTKNGSTVSLILEPVQLEELIKNGRFVMNQAVDPSKMISYVAPDYPGVNDTSLIKTALDANGAPRSNVQVSLAGPNGWVPTGMTLHDHDMHAARSTRHLPSWARRNFAKADAELASMRKKQVGFPQGVPKVPTLAPLNIPPTLVTGPPPTTNVGNGDVRIENIANNSYVGVQYYYTKGNTGATAAGLVSMHAPVIRCVLTFKDGHADSAGLDIKGAAGIKIRLDAHSSTDKLINFKLAQFVPINISIPLGGPVPLSLTFATFFNINSAFSAKSSIMVAEGEYTFSGGVWAGRAGGSWHVATPASFKAVKSLGNSVAGLSVGINSFTLAFGIRTMVGVGAFGFNVGVFATVRFGGGLVISPTTAYACRQGTIDGFIDTGVGYQLPKPFAIVMNFFLAVAGAKPIDAAGTLARGPSINLFSDDVSVPDKCASQKSG